QGVKVLIMEKANTRRSGIGATGNDHFLAYNSELHGDLAPYMEECFETLVGKAQDRPLMERHLLESFDRIRDWDNWGINMKPTGDWEFVGHALPGRVRTHLKYAGANQKEVLTKQAKKAGVAIMNKVAFADLIKEDDKVVGAVGIDISEKIPKLQIIKSKAVVMATGAACRLYVPKSPGWMFNTPFCPSSTGTGRAAALRAGAKLVNMEFPYTHAGPKYLARCGKATWIGVLRDPNGDPAGPFVTEPEKLYGDPTADIWNSVFDDMHKSGKGPVYMDCAGISEKDYEYMMWALVHEGNTGMVNYMREKGIDPRKHGVEFTRYEPNPIKGGIEITRDAETCVPGLFAAGDEVGNFCAFIAGACTYGWIAGGSAAHYAKSVPSLEKAEESPTVAQKKAFYSEILSRPVGPGWKEANLAVQAIMTDYAGKEVRSHTLLSAGLKYLRDLKAMVHSELRAQDSHTLMRCLEVMDLIEVGETIFLTALERKETRGVHVRADCPFTNPLLNFKFLTVKQEDGEFKLEWRDQVR
ncbi:MAG: FAD-binding protein, partial [Desulfobacterales bacterium]|nr:FAD-binding protein [Desulfobacterales bacterium]